MFKKLSKKKSIIFTKQIEHGKRITFLEPKNDYGQDRNKAHEFTLC